MLATDLIHIVLPPTRREATDKIIELFQEYTGLQMGSLAAHWTELVFPNDPERMDEPTDLLDYFVLQSIPYIHDSLLQMQAYTEKYPTNRSTAEDAMGFVALYGMTAAAEMIYGGSRLMPKLIYYYNRTNVIDKFVALYGESALMRISRDGDVTDFKPNLTPTTDSDFADDFGIAVILPLSTLLRL